MTASGALKDGEFVDLFETFKASQQECCFMEVSVSYAVIGK